MSGPGLKLQYERADGEVDTYHLKPDRRYHIGRGSTCEIRILDMKMSRQHCAVEYQGGLWLLLDLGSTNGVLVDGVPVQDRRPLMDGCEVLLGNTMLVVTGIDETANDAASAYFHRQRREQKQAAASSGASKTDSESLRSDSDFLPDTGSVGNTAALEHGGSAPGRLPAPGKLDRDAGLDSATLEIPDLQSLGPMTGPLEARGARAEPIELDDDHTATVANAPAVDLSKPPPADPPDRVRTPPPDDTSASARRRTASGRIRPITIRVGKTAPPQAAEPSPRDATDNRLLYINVLGRRIGPVSRTRARELKALELKGQLTETHLAEFEN